MALPNPGWNVVYGEIPAASKWSQLGANDDALAAGTGLNDGAITNVKMAANTLQRNKVDWSNMFANNVKSAANTSTKAMTNNANNNLGDVGAQVQFTLAGAGVALVRVDIGINSTSDFEMKPLVYLNGALQNSYEIPASVGNGSGRHIYRGGSFRVPLAAGVNTISAGVMVASYTAGGISTGSCRVSAIVLGEVTA